MSNHAAASNNGRGPAVNFPRPDYSRIPYWLYHDRAVYRLGAGAHLQGTDLVATSGSKRRSRIPATSAPATSATRR